MQTKSSACNLHFRNLRSTNYVPLDLLRSITDPEHPTTTLEQLGVISADQIKVTGDRVDVQFTPTVPHCGMATLIGMYSRGRIRTRT